MTAGVVKLTEQQFLAFVEDSLDGSGPCQVREDLPLADLADTDVVPNARILMTLLEGGGARLTVKGNLNRKSVEALMESFRWDDYNAGEIRAVSRVVNEHDFPPAMYLHAVLRLARLVRSEKGFLKLTKTGRTLLQDEAAGRCQAVLFRTTFARYNPAYLDGFDMPEVFAPQISLILYLIGQFCTDWRPADALMRSVTVPTKELTEPAYPGLPAAAFQARVLRYLRWFGLLEARRPAANIDRQQPRLYRKTPLYDRMLCFAPLR